MTEPKNTPKIIGSFVISAVLLIGAYVVLAQNANEAEVATSVSVSTSQEDTNATSETTAADSAEPATEETQPAANTTTSETPAATSDYIDGTYAAELTYSVPEGHQEDISVSLTITNDRVTALSVNTVATNDESAEYQSGFDSRIRGTVEGQDLDEADVSRLGGASLTSDAFNDLLDAIRNEARS